MKNIIIWLLFAAEQESKERNKQTLISIAVGTMKN